MRLDAAAREAMVAHAQEGAPEEVLGVLVGERDPDRVTRIERATNAAADPERRYELAPAEVVSILDAVERSGEAVVGFYHSHPRGPPAPSATDERLATWDGYVYAIVSLEETPSVGAWRWTSERFVALDVE